jgi:hypothetical protein
MPDDATKVLTKVRDLLRLADSPSENEARSAALRAARMINEHELTVTSASYLTTLEGAVKILREELEKRDRELAAARAVPKRRLKGKPAEAVDTLADILSDVVTQGAERAVEKSAKRVGAVVGQALKGAWKAR